MPILTDRMTASIAHSTTLNNRNNVAWTYSVVTNQNGTFFQIVLAAKFKPFDFRRVNREYLQEPSNQSDSESMHAYMDNRLANFVYFTLYNYAPFAFLKSEDACKIVNLSGNERFIEIPYESIEIVPELANHQNESDIILDRRFGGDNYRFNIASQNIITNNQDFYNGYYGRMFDFHSALNTNMFFDADVVRHNYVLSGNCDETFTNFNKILKVLKSGSAGEMIYDEYYNRYLLYNENTDYGVIIKSQQIPVVDEDRTYLILFGNPFLGDVTPNYYYTEKSYTPQTQTIYELANDGFDYNGKKDVDMLLSIGNNNKLSISSKTTKWNTKRVNVKMKVKKREIQV